MAELPDDEVEAVAQAAAGAARAGGGVVQVRAALLPELHLLAARVRAEAVADERQRIVGDLHALIESDRTPSGAAPLQMGPAVGVHFAIEVIERAAGSVPVATPPTCGHANWRGEGGHWLPAGHPMDDPEWCPGPGRPSGQVWSERQQAWVDPLAAGPVATPTEPEEPRCLKDGATFEEHYERGITEGREAAAEEAAAAVVKLKTAAGERLALNYTVRDHSRVDDFLAAEQAIRLHFLRAAASPAAEPPAASWGDPAADVMRLVDQTLDGEAPVSTDQPAPWFRETRESLAMLDDVRAEVEAVEAAAEQPEGR